MGMARHHVRSAGLAILGWTAVAAVFALPGLSTGGDWRRPLWSACAQWWSWGLVAPLIVAADRRLPCSEKDIGRRLLAHVPLSLAMTALYIYVAAAVRAAMGLGTWAAVSDLRLLTSALQGMFLWSWLVYWLIVGAWLARQYHQRFLSSELRVERMERLSSDARLHALRLQLDPHFLFNTLNTISAQVEHHPKLARRMIEHLGDLLRLTLETRDRPDVSLAEEMAFLEHYLEIQRIRFGDRLKFDTSIAPEASHALVPALIVQPLVENAIRHGISKRASGGTVVVSAQVVGDHLTLLVQDDGAGLPADWQADVSSGLGLSVTRQRVLGLYPAGTSRFEVRRRTGGGTEVEIRLPLKTDRPEVSRD